MSATLDKCDAMHPDEWGAGLRMKGKTLSIKTVRRAKSPNDVVPVCLAHNLRQGNAEHRHRIRINSALTPNNEVLRGPQSLAVALEIVESILTELDVVPARCDAIMGLEFVLQPPDGADTPEFWAECLVWAASRYEHIVSAVVHRDQKRPHMHVLVLAVSGGRLAGHALSAGKNLLVAQRREFMGHMRNTLNLRPDRQVKQVKVKTLADFAVSTGRGQKSHTAAAKSDDAMMARAKHRHIAARKGMAVDGHGGLAENTTSATTDRHAHTKTPTALIAQFSDADNWWQKLTRTAADSTSLTSLWMAA